MPDTLYYYVCYARKSHVSNTVGPTWEFLEALLEGEHPLEALLRWRAREPRVTFTVISWQKISMEVYQEFQGKIG